MSKRPLRHCPLRLTFTYSSREETGCGLVCSGDSWAHDAGIVRLRLQRLILRPGSNICAPVKARYSVSLRQDPLCMIVGPFRVRVKFFILGAFGGRRQVSARCNLSVFSWRSRLLARPAVRLNRLWATLHRLIIRDQRMWQGFGARGNANGPGTARLFHELGLETNFDNFDRKTRRFHEIFWSRPVGAKV